VSAGIGFRFASARAGVLLFRFHIIQISVNILSENADFGARFPPLHEARGK
jgi:hypothetical protein